MIIYKYEYHEFSGDRHNFDARLAKEQYVLNNTKENREAFCVSCGMIDFDFINNDSHKNKTLGIGFSIKQVWVKE